MHKNKIANFFRLDQAQQASVVPSMGAAILSDIPALSPANAPDLNTSKSRIKARPKTQLWTVGKDPAPLPLGLRGRHILTGEELSKVELTSILDFAAHLKAQRAEGRSRPWLLGRHLALIFEKAFAAHSGEFHCGYARSGWSCHRHPLECSQV